jgi:predicted Zn-dependent peptidase
MTSKKAKGTSFWRHSESFRKTILPNGLRIVAERIPHVRSVSFGVWVDVGSRDEKLEKNGLSHFAEHMVFKGTKTRSAQQIAQFLESVGGHLNAFTSREQTCYYAKVLDENLPQAVEIIADILRNSILREEDVKKEKKVILEEIKDVADSPAEMIHDLFALSLWSKHSLGYPVMGRAESVRGFSRADLVSFIQHNYSPRRIVIAASGNLVHQRLIQYVETLFPLRTDRGKSLQRSSPEAAKNVKFKRKKTTQTHLCLGFPSFPFSDPARPALSVLNNIVGAGMSSRLFQKVREEKSLVYTIYSYIDFYQDTGIFGIYFATSERQIRRALGLVIEELENLRAGKLGDSELTDAKNQLKGQLMLGLESTSNRMHRIAKHELLVGKFISLDESLNLIDGVTIDEVVSAADRVFDPEYCCLAGLGPVNRGSLNGLSWFQ